MRIREKWVGPLAGLTVFLVLLGLGFGRGNSGRPAGVPEPGTADFEDYLDRQIDRGIAEIDDQQISVGESFDSILDRRLGHADGEPLWYVTEAEPAPSEQFDQNDYEHLGEFALDRAPPLRVPMAIVAQFSSSAEAADAFDALADWVDLAQPVAVSGDDHPTAVEFATGERQWMEAHGVSSPIDGLGLIAADQRRFPMLQRVDSVIVVSELVALERYLWESDHPLHEVFDHLGALFVVRELGEWSYGAVLNVICEGPAAAPRDIVVALYVGRDVRSPLVRPPTDDESWARDSWLVMSEVSQSVGWLSMSRSYNDSETLDLMRELTPDDVHPEIEQHWLEGGDRRQLHPALGIVENTAPTDFEIMDMTAPGDDVMFTMALLNVGKTLQPGLRYIDDLGCAQVLVKLADRNQDNV